MFHNSHSPRTSRVLFLIALIFTVCLATTPAFAADPEEADPDPDGFAAGGSGPTVLVLSDLSELDTARLEPGHYIIRITGEDGTRAVYEIVVGPSR